MDAKAGDLPLFAFARPALRGKPDESARELERLLSEMEWVDAQGNGKPHLKRVALEVAKTAAWIVHQQMQMQRQRALLVQACPSASIEHRVNVMMLRREWDRHSVAGLSASAHLAARPVAQSRQIVLCWKDELARGQRALWTGRAQCPLIDEQTGAECLSLDARRCAAALSRYAAAYMACTDAQETLLQWVRALARRQSLLLGLDVLKPAAGSESDAGGCEHENGNEKPDSTSTCPALTFSPYDISWLSCMLLKLACPEKTQTGRAALLNWLDWLTPSEACGEYGRRLALETGEYIRRRILTLTHQHLFVQERAREAPLPATANAAPDAAPAPAPASASVPGPIPASVSGAGPAPASASVPVPAPSSPRSQWMLRSLLWLPGFACATSASRDAHALQSCALSAAQQAAQFMEYLARNMLGMDGARCEALPYVFSGVQMRALLQHPALLTSLEMDAMREWPRTLHQIGKCRNDAMSRCANHANCNPANDESHNAWACSLDGGVQAVAVQLSLPLQALRPAPPALADQEKNQPNQLESGNEAAASAFAAVLTELARCRAPVRQDGRLLHLLLEQMLSAPEMTGYVDAMLQGLVHDTHGHPAQALLLPVQTLDDLLVQPLVINDFSTPSADMKGRMGSAAAARVLLPLDWLYRRLAQPVQAAWRSGGGFVSSWLFTADLHAADCAEGFGPSLKDADTDAVAHGKAASAAWWVPMRCAGSLRQALDRARMMALLRRLLSEAGRVSGGAWALSEPNAASRVRLHACHLPPDGPQQRMSAADLENANTWDASERSRAFFSLELVSPDEADGAPLTLSRHPMLEYIPPALQLRRMQAMLQGTFACLRTS